MEDLQSEAIDQVKSIAGAEAITQFIKSPAQRKKIKDSFIFAIKNIPFSGVYFKLMEEVLKPNSEINTKKETLKDLVFSYLSALFAKNLTDNKYFSEEERSNLFKLSYVILKRLMWFTFYQQRESQHPGATYFVEYATGIIKDLISASVIGSE